MVLPKELRDQLRLSPGDRLELESDGERITLRPLRARVVLKTEHGVRVYQGEPANVSIPALIHRQRKRRLRKLMG